MRDVRAHRARLLLLAVIAIELVAAGWRRWPLTTAAIRTQVEYQIGQIAITTEHWRREGAVARHLLPARAIDYRLTEWSSYDQDYVTVPPLSFVLHDIASRALPRVEPVFLAKLVAQAQIAAGMLIAAALLYSTFSFWPTLLALSFLIWTRPFLIWFVDGYFPTTTALVVQFVFIAWTLRRVHAWAMGESSPPSRSARHAATAAALAVLGAMAESIALLVNVLVAAVFVAMAWSAGRAGRPAREWWRTAVAIAGSTAAALAILVALYATVSDFGVTFADRFSRRTGAKTGRAGILAHAQVIWRQMHTAWPEWLLILLGAGALAVVVWIVVALARRESGTARARAYVYAAALGLGLLPSLLYHYILQNHVSIHWWFTGTWAIGGAFIIATCAQLAGQTVDRLARASVAGRVAYATVCTLIVAASIWSRGNAAELRPPVAADVFPSGVYRALGERLPPDGFPLVATHFVDGSLFTHYPYSTAYVRRPVVLLRDDGALTLPWGDVAADLARLQEIGTAYVAYNPFGRRCVGDDVPLSGWRQLWLRVCRVDAAQLLARRGAILERVDVSRVVGSAPPASSASHADERLANLQARLARGEPLDDHAELMALARASRTIGWPDLDALHAVLQRVAPAQANGEAAQLLRAQLESQLGDPALGAHVVRAGGEVPASIDMHGWATFVGFTVHPGPNGAHEVTVYFRPSSDWTGQYVWMHAYPEGSPEYVIIESKAPAFANWKAGELAWDVFEVPASPRHNTFVGVASGGDLGPAAPLGWISR